MNANRNVLIEWRIENDNERICTFLCRGIKKLPTQKTVVKVCNKILHLQVDGRDITSSEVEIILGYIEDEIGDYGFLNENYDNHETLTLMSQVRKIIAQANGGK